MSVGVVQCDGHFSCAHCTGRPRLLEINGISSSAFTSFWADSLFLQARFPPSVLAHRLHTHHTLGVCVCSLSQNYTLSVITCPHQSLTQPGCVHLVSAEFLVSLLNSKVSQSKSGSEADGRTAE